MYWVSPAFHKTHLDKARKCLLPGRKETRRILKSMKEMIYCRSLHEVEDDFIVYHLWTHFFSRKAFNHVSKSTTAMRWNKAKDNHTLRCILVYPVTQSNLRMVVRWSLSHEVQVTEFANIPFQQIPRQITVKFETNEVTDNVFSWAPGAVSLSLLNKLNINHGYQ